VTRRAVSPMWIVLACSAWMAAAGNGALWQRLAALGLLHDVRGWAFAAGMGLMIAALLTTLLALLAWRFTLKPVASVLLLATALASHFMLSYGVVIDPGMMVNVLQTDVHEAGGLLDLRLVLSVVLLALPPIVLLWRQPVAYGGAGRQLARNALLLTLPLLVFAGTLMASFQTLASVMRSHTDPGPYRGRPAETRQRAAGHHGR
jgi:lipid A ethanolaminephosphotransferase